MKATVRSGTGSIEAPVGAPTARRTLPCTRSSRTARGDHSRAAAPILPLPPPPALGAPPAQARSSNTSLGGRPPARACPAAATAPPRLAGRVHISRSALPCAFVDNRPRRSRSRSPARTRKREPFHAGSPPRWVRRWRVGLGRALLRNLLVRYRRARWPPSASTQSVGGKLSQHDSPVTGPPRGFLTISASIGGNAGCGLDR